MGDRRSTIAVLAVGVLLTAPLAACSDSSTGPESVERSDVVGSYEATTMETTDGGGDTTDLLAEGGSLTLTLGSDGSTDGRLFIPATTGTEGTDTDASMAGTWSYDASGDTVRLDQNADTFVRDMPFRAERASGRIRLVGDETNDGLRIEVVLTPQ